MKISQFCSLSKARLASAPIQCLDPSRHSAQLIGQILHLNSAQLYLSWDDEIAEPALAELNGLLSKRCSGIPFQYLVGEEGFWNSMFKVGPGVLIPRPETELLVETMLEREGQQKIKVAELGAGCGNIGISVLNERQAWEWHAFENKTDAVTYLVRNIELLRFKENFYYHPTDFFSAASQYAPFDWVVSNPPYIATDELERLPLEIRHEPRAALDGGKEGVMILSRLIEMSAEILRKGGKVLVEIGWNQAEYVTFLLAQIGFTRVEVLKDYSNLPRAVIATWGQ